MSEIYLYLIPFLAGSFVTALLMWFFWVRKIRWECNEWALLAGKSKRMALAAYTQMEEIEQRGSEIESLTNFD